MSTLAEHFPTGNYHQPDETFAGECSCGHTFYGPSYAASKQAWAEHALVHTAAPQGEEGQVDIAAIQVVTAQMRRLMPNACGDWADQIDAALNVPQSLTSAEHGELCGYLHGKDYRDNTVEAVAARQRRFEYLKQRHDRLAALAPAAIASGRGEGE